MAVSFKGAHFPPEIILMGVRWYVAYPLSTRHIEELMEKRGVHVDHSTINRWVIKYSPQLEEAFPHSPGLCGRRSASEGEGRLYLNSPLIHNG
jgi:transposase-like protein